MGNEADLNRGTHQQHKPGEYTKRGLAIFLFGFLSYFVYPTAWLGSPLGREIRPCPARISTRSWSGMVWECVQRESPEKPSIVLSQSAKPAPLPRPCHESRYRSAMPRFIFNSSGVCAYHLSCTEAREPAGWAYLTFLTTSSTASAKYLTLLSFKPAMLMRPFLVR